MEVEHFAELGGEPLALEQVGDAHRAARDLVFVGRADAPTGGADGIGAARRFARRSSTMCEGRISGQVGDTRSRSNTGTPWSMSICALAEQRLERDHHAVADEALHALAHDARGNQRQHRLLAADDQRVPGVVPALEARHGARALGQQVDDLALAFIAPLGADDDDELDPWDAS